MASQELNNSELDRMADELNATTQPQASVSSAAGLTQGTDISINSASDLAMPSWALSITSSVDALTKCQAMISSSLNEVTSKLSSSSNSSYQWKKEGLKRQYDVTEQAVQHLKAAEVAYHANQLSSGHKLLQDGMKILLERMHCLQIADSSPGGWDTVNEYLASPLAIDDEDDRRIKRAEKHAMEKKKEREEARKPAFLRRSQVSPYTRDRQERQELPTHSIHQPDRSYSNYRASNAHKSLSNVHQPSYFQSEPRSKFSGAKDVCYFCGQKGHWADTCPEKRNTFNKVSTYTHNLDSAVYIAYIFKNLVIFTTLIVIYIIQIYCFYCTS